jgi:hypothetical protein
MINDNIKEFRKINKELKKIIVGTRNTAWSETE